MPKADTENGDFSNKVTNCITTDARFLWITWSWRDAEKIGLVSVYFFEGCFIILNNVYVGAELAEVLNKVVSEGVVVVDKEKFHKKEIQFLIFFRVRSERRPVLLHDLQLSFSNRGDDLQHVFLCLVQFQL